MREVKPRRQPRRQPPEVRKKNFEEVSEGFTAEDALAESQRCILCKNPRCQTACPLKNQIPQWIAQVQQGHLDEAYRIIRQTSPMPDLCSRLCPQERLCEGACAVGIKHESVAIGLLERYVADQAAKRPELKDQPGSLKPAQAKKRVAAVGSGPASLAFAQRMACCEGHAVTIFERWPGLGGVLRWIPRFKLPTEVINHHIEALKQVGVTFKTGVEIRSVNELLNEGFDGVFLGVGASRPSSPKIPGSALAGILSSTEFLVRIYFDSETLPNNWQPMGSLAGKRVVVLGGGDSAMDCVRSAIRLGASSVTCVYRRDEANMPGSKKEVKAAKEEGANLQFLSSQVAFHSHDGSAVSHVECIRMELGAPDASGRRSPVAVKDSTFNVDADLVVLAFGYEVEPTLDEHAQLIPPPKGIIQINPATGATAVAGVCAGGDCVTGPSLVSTAARSGIVAAEGLLRYFAGESWEALATLPASTSQA
jgi:glutamate synthase (NADPH/NADH) small chain